MYTPVRTRQSHGSQLKLNPSTNAKIHSFFALHQEDEQEEELKYLKYVLNKICVHYFDL